MHDSDFENDGVFVDVERNYENEDYSDENVERSSENSEQNSEFEESDSNTIERF